MKTIAQLISFTATVYCIGSAIYFVVFQRARLSRIEMTAFAFGFGLGSTPLLMFYLALTGARLSAKNLLFLLGPLGLFSVILIWYRRRKSQAGDSRLVASLSPLEKWLTALIVGAIVFAIVFAISKPFDVWDAVTTWGFKAKVLYYEQTIYTDALLDRDDMLIRVRPRPQYPLGLPLLGHLIAVFAGVFDESILKFVSAIFFGLLVLAMYATCRAQFVRRHALLGCALLVSVPFIYYQTIFRVLLVGGKKSAILGGMADLPLACFIFLSATSLFRWITRSERAYLISAAVFAAFAGFMKNEGLALSLIIMATLGLSILRHRQERSWHSLAIFALIWLALIVPWLMFRQTLPPEPALERFQLDWSEALRTFQTVPRAIVFFLREAGDITSWGLIWIFWGILSLVRWQRIRTTPLKYLYLIILSGLLVDVLVVAFAPVSHVVRSFFQSRTVARLLFQLMPLAIFLTVQLIVHEGHEMTQSENGD